MNVHEQRVVDCDANEIRWRVVEPVVRSLIKPDELERVDVGWGPRDNEHGWLTASGRGDAELWALVRARSELWHSLIWMPNNPKQNTLGQLATQLANRLEDWVCETRFAWSEQRIASYVILPPMNVELDPSRL